MGIFMITISQISSHTIVGVYPCALRLTRHGGLQGFGEQLTAARVVLRDLEAGARRAGVDTIGARDSNG